MGDIANKAVPMGGYELKLWVVLESLLRVHFPWSDKRVTGAIGASHRAFPLPPDSSAPHLFLPSPGQALVFCCLLGCAFSGRPPCWGPATCGLFDGLRPR